MPPSQNPEWQSLSFTAVVLREIMENPLEDETPQSRLEQVGMMNVLYYMHVRRRPLTHKSIMKETGLTNGGVTETVNQLVRRLMLSESPDKDANDQGQVRQFVIAPSLFRRSAPF